MNWNRIALVLGVALALPFGAPARAQDEDFHLLDKFVFTIGGAFSETNSVLRVDSDTLGIGTELNLEDDLGLDSGAASIDLGFEWQVGRRHRLFFSYFDIQRSDSQSAMRDVQIGDLIIPVGFAYSLDFDITDYRIGYTYYPWLRERWALGFGIGVRVLDMNLRVALQGDLGVIDFETSDEEASVVGPLPFLGVEYRNGFTPRWLFTARGGWLAAEVGDYEGGQWLLQASIENRITKRFGLGGSLGYSTVDVDTTDENFQGHADLDYLTARLFFRVFWN